MANFFDDIPVKKTVAAPAATGGNFFDTVPAKQRPEKDAFTDLDTSVTSRIMHGAVDPAYGIAQLVPRGLQKATNAVGDLVANVSPDAGMAIQDTVGKFFGNAAAYNDKMTQERAAEYDRQRAAAGQDGTDVARLVGNVVSPVNAGTGAIASKLPVASTFAGKLLQNVGIGAAGAATQPVEDPNAGSFADQKVSQMEAGALTAGGLQTAGRVVGGVIKPTLQKGAEKLMQEGIRLTPGQLKGGWFQAIEDKMTSIPLLGDAIKNARVRGYQDMNKAVANRALMEIGEKVPGNVPAGRDLVEYTANKLGERYDAILPKMQGVVDDQLMKDVARIGSKAQMGLPDSQLKVFQNLVKSQFAKQNGSTISGEELKMIKSNLAQEAAGYNADPNFDNRKLAQVIQELGDALTNMAKRNNPPELSAALAATDKGWANFVRLRGAAQSLGAKDGVFTPAQLQSSVKTSQKSVGNGQFAKGKNLMQDLSDPAVSVLPSTVPDSGTAGRAFAGLLGLGATNAIPGVGLGTAATGLAATSLYTRPGIAAMEYLIARRPDLAEPVAQAIKAGTSPIDIIRAIFGNGKTVGGNAGVPALKQ